MSKLIFFKFGPGPTMMDTAVFDCEGKSAVEIDKIAYELAVDQAECFASVYLGGEEPEEPEDEEYFLDTDLSYTWEEYDPKKHDMYKSGGGSFLDDLKND